MTKPLTIVAASAHAGLLTTVKKAGTAYINAVQTAAIQAIGHALQTGDTTFATRVLETFSENTVGKATFVTFMETKASMKYQKKQLVWNHETKHNLPFKKSDEEIIACLEEINKTCWKDAKPEKVVSVYDVEEIVANAIKKAQASSEKDATLVANVGLLKHLTAAMAQYHSEKLGVVEAEAATVEAPAAE